MVSRSFLRRLSAAVLCVALLLSCCSVLAESAVVGGYLLRLRSSGSEKASVIDAFPRGTKVQVLERGDDWTKVKVSGKTGYMMSDYLKFSSAKEDSDPKSSSSSSSSASSSSSSSSSDGKKTMKVWTESGSRLNLREGPGMDYDVLGSYRPGTRVTVLQRRSAWTKVSIDGKVGYMGSQYLVND